MQNRKLKIGIVVGEVSGDTLGAQLMRRFREQGIDAEFEGIGGPQMIAEGFHSEYPMDILSVMGIVEVLKDIILDNSFYKIISKLIKSNKKTKINQRLCKITKHV